nr:5708_t:CDS:2 [Entrophospora candida]
MVEWIYLTIPCPVLGCPRGDDDVGNWYHAVCGQTAKISDDRIKFQGIVSFLPFFPILAPTPMDLIHQEYLYNNIGPFFRDDEFKLAQNVDKYES